MRYTKKQFDAEYPNSDVCLQSVFDNRFSDLRFCPKCAAETKFYRVKKRQSFACMHCGYQLYPLAGTIFRKTTTPLKDWFYAIYLFSVSKNGVSAKELERHLGCTYKTAWRMARQIRLLMAQDNRKLMGIVEADETYIGGRKQQRYVKDNKTAVVGIVEKQGRLKAKALERHDFGRPTATAAQVMPYLKANILPLSVLHTDKSHLYLSAKDTFKHRTVDHGMTYVQNGVHTNNLEVFWSQFKRSISGTYHHVSPQHLQLYVDEFVFRYNYRDGAVCPLLLERAGSLAV